MRKNMELAHKNVLVVGLGRSGAAAAAFLKRKGAVVTVTDTGTEQQIGPVAGELGRLGVAVEIGGHDPESFNAAELIVVSPGVPHTIAPIVQASERGVPVIGEVELASRFIAEPVVAVTGTNGKTTATLLIGEMLRRSGLDTFVGGNIGTPLVEYTKRTRRADVIVAEVSSFQLDTIAGFKPHVGVLLNITEDHLDRYPDFEGYARSKARLFENQSEEDIAIINGADPVVENVCRKINAKKLYFNIRNGSDEGVRVDGNRLAIFLPDHFENRKIGGERRFSLDLSRVRFKGRHNFENAGAASLAALAAGGSIEGVRAAMDDFLPPEHRLELVETIDGVGFYNDSKATNVDAVKRALESFEEPVVLIMGGRDKGGDFGALAGRIRGNVTQLILMGEARETIARALDREVGIALAGSMEEAVDKAAALSVPGQSVVLSPGCTSFDMYTDYAERGVAFKAAVVGLRRGIDEEA